jgi:hypothetical protein
VRRRGPNQSRRFCRGDPAGATAGSS